MTKYFQNKVRSNAIEGKEENIVSAESCIIAMEVSEALSQSLKTGSIVKL